MCYSLSLPSAALWTHGHRGRDTWAMGTWRLALALALDWAIYLMAKGPMRGSTGMGLFLEEVMTPHADAYCE